jgi:glucose/arabinose dehydrogenase
MRRLLGPACAVAAGLVFVGTEACTSSDSGSPPASGGATASGGSSPSDASVSGGSPAAGGTAGTGGTAESGGAPQSGGTSGSGGDSASGGTDSGTTSKLRCVAPTRNQTVGNPCPGTSPPALKLTQVATGFQAPVYVTQAPGDTERLYVVEQVSGLIRTVKDGAIEETPFLDIKSLLGDIGASQEQGFLGLAFDPYYETSRRFFVKYSGKTGQGKHVIAEYKVGSNGVADPDSARIILQFNHLDPLGNHNGGMLAFGADGCLYASVGDGGGSEPDKRNTGQDPSDYFGSILRLDVDSFPTPAPGNMGAPANAHVWNYGLRNPWRFSFDSANGDMYIGDVGDGQWEEVDVEPRGAITGGRPWRARTAAPGIATRRA